MREDLNYLLEQYPYLQYILWVWILYILIVILYPAYKAGRYGWRSREIIELLQGSLWNAVRHMENATRGMPGSLGRKRTETVQSFIAPPAQMFPKLQRLRIDKLPETHTKEDVAFRLIEMNESAASDHWFKVNGIRTGMQALVHLVETHNVRAAFLLVIELMKRQRDEFKIKGTQKTDNFTELKLVLGLPTDWPTGDMPEELLHKGISLAKQEEIAYAVTRSKYRHYLFDKLVHKKWPEGLETERTIYEGYEVVEAIKDYIR